LTCGSTDHALIVSIGMPAARRADPKGSEAQSAPSQFIRSARASNGDADACTPLSPTSGADASPRASHLALTSPLRESAGASAGSVGPRSAPRKSAHEHDEASQSTEKYVIFNPGVVNFVRMLMKKPLNT